MRPARTGPPREASQGVASPDLECGLRQFLRGPWVLVGTPGQFRHGLLDAGFNLEAFVLDKGRIRRNKGTRRTPALHACIHEKWTDREDTEPEFLVLGFRAGACSGATPRDDDLLRQAHNPDRVVAAVALAASVPGILPSARAGPEAADEATRGDGREARPADAGYVELQRQLNELRSDLLDEREQRIGRQLEANGAVLVVLGIVIGVGGLWFYARFRAIAAEARIGATAARHYVLAPPGPAA